MRIAFASPVSISHYAGCEKWIVGTANALVHKGHSVDIYATPYTPRRNISPSNVLQSSVRYFEGWSFDLSDEYDVVYMVYTPLVWRVFKAKSPKVAGLHYHLCFPSELEKSVLDNLALALKCYDIVSIVTYWAFRVFGKCDMKSFNAVHIPNNPFHISIPHRNIYFIPNWIDLNFYRPTESKESEFTILFVGRHDWEKGWVDYNLICKMLKEKGYPIRCVSTGEGSRYVEGLGFLSDRELVDLYSRSHLLIHPSKSDMFGLVILEALACNTPVVTTSIEAHRALNLPLMYADTVVEFFEKILLVYDLWRKGEYSKLASNLRTHVIKYGISSILPKIENMLRDVAEQVN